jgi:uncharacterized protein YndB with AHSA1/START domain
MKHLGVLEASGLLVVERRGRERWNHINAVPLRQELERWLTPFGTRLAEASLALKQAVEATETEGDPMTDQKTQLASGEIDVASELEIAAPREKVFAAVTEVGQWWPHRFREGSSVVLERRVGGRFYEDWGDDSGALYGVVGTFDRPARFSIAGPMGMGGPVTSVWSLELVEAGPDRTVLRGSHRAFGDISDETREAYTQGWAGVYQALQDHLGISG